MDNPIIIFTADDYGAYDEIDNGIIAAADNRWINSVAMLANGEDFQKAVNKIKPYCLGTDGMVDIGLHFTMNSGKALSNQMRNNEHFTHNEHFRPFTNMNISDILNKKNLHRNMEDLKSEIRAQIKRLEDAGLNVKHLSSHFNVLHFYRPFLEAQYQVLAESSNTNIKIRSTQITPKMSRWFLPLLARVSTSFRGEIDTEIDVTKCIEEQEVPKYLESIHKYVESRKKANIYTPEMPDLLDGFHYDALGSVRLGKSTKAQKAKRKAKQLKKKYEEAHISNEIIEFVFHLADFDFMQNHNMTDKEFINFLEQKYLGVTPKYMDNRAIEFDSLRRFSTAHGINLPSNPWTKF